jgi:hypothetical protein
MTLRPWAFASACGSRQCAARVSIFLEAGATVRRRRVRFAAHGGLPSALSSEEVVPNTIPQHIRIVFGLRAGNR